MIRDFLRKIRQKRNFWFLASFDEIRIIYMADLIRNIAINLTSGIVFMYFYKIGYGWDGILLLLALSYLVKLAFVWIAGIYIAKHGPKHGILLSNLLHIPMMIAASMAKDYGVWMAILAIVIQGAAISIHNISKYVNFAKVKSVKRAGRQLGMMHIIEKSAGIFSPLLGGFLAVVIGPRSAMLVSAILFVFSAIPLLSTREATATNIELNFKKFPFRKYLKNVFMPQIWISPPTSVIHYVWGVFVPVFIFSKDNPYGVMSILASFTAVTQIMSAVIVGKVIDKKFGGKMLRVSLFFRGLANIARGLWVNSVFGVIITQIITGLTSIGQAMSMHKGGAFEAEESGQRIEFFVIQETFFFVGSLIYSIVVYLLFVWFGAEAGIRAFLIISGLILVFFGDIKYSVYKIK